jgi:hypothetical protein
MTVLTQDLTFKYTDTGVVLNTDPPGDFIDIDRITGLDNAPYRETERDHEGVDGGFLDAEFEKSRSVTLSGTVYSTPTTIMALLDQLKENFAPTRVPQPLYLLMGSVGERVIFAKSRGCLFDITTAYRTGTTPIKFEMLAEDPIIYDSALQTAPVPLGVTVGTGIGFPLGFPFDFGAVAPGVDGVDVYNAGNRPAPATLTIAGGTGVTDPIIVNDATGSTLKFVGLTLSSTDTLVIDLRNKTVTLNGSTNRRSKLINPQWFYLAKGINHIRYRAAVTGTGSTLTVAWRNPRR